VFIAIPCGAVQWKEPMYSRWEAASSLRLDRWPRAHFYSFVLMWANPSTAVFSRERISRGLDSQDRHTNPPGRDTIRVGEGSPQL
jgi:hypothetical protein